MQENFDKYFEDNAPAKRLLLEEAFQSSPDVKAMYDALQHFHDITQSCPLSFQKELLSEWINEYKYSDVEELRSAVSTIRIHRAYIINAWQYGRSNGPCEGLNKKIKDLKRALFGIHSFESFRKRILLTCGGLNPDSENLIFHIGKEDSPWS